MTRSYGVKSAKIFFKKLSKSWDSHGRWLFENDWKRVQEKKQLDLDTDNGDGLESTQQDYNDGIQWGNSKWVLQFSAIDSSQRLVPCWWSELVRRPGAGWFCQAGSIIHSIQLPTCEGRTLRASLFHQHWCIIRRLASSERNRFPTELVLANSCPARLPSFTDFDLFNIDHLDRWSVSVIRVVQIVDLILPCLPPSFSHNMALKLSAAY